MSAVTKMEKPDRQKTFSLFNPSKSVLEAIKQQTGLKLSRNAFGQTGAEADNPTTDIDAEKELSRLKVADCTACSTCGIKFADLSVQREHFKLDWHRFNLKETLAGRKAVTEDGFEALLETGDADDVSLSGSDEEEEESSDAEDESEKKLKRQRHPWFFFEDAQGGLMSVHKCVVDVKLERGEDVEESAMLEAFTELCGNSHTSWAIIMLGGGHFAGAIFEGQKVVVHKTFHCYTVRAKQGGSQSAKDNKSGGSHLKSAGASLRRYNEASLAQHVKDIMSAWSQQIMECHRIFFRATSGNRTLLFSGKDAPLDRSDPRLRSIPFPTKRATFHEVKRVHEVLSTVQMHGDGRAYAEGVKQRKEQAKTAKVQASGSGSQSKQGKIRRSKSREPVIRQLPEEVQHLLNSSSSSEDECDVNSSLNFESFVSSTVHLMEFDGTPVPGKSNRGRSRQKKEVDDDSKDFLASRLITACKSDNVTDLTAILDELDDELELRNTLNQQHGNSKVTLLHLAAADGKRSVVKFLLKRGADPCIRDKAKKVPYQHCPDKETRKAFMAFRGDNPDAHDYTAAMIPPPASAEAETRQKEKRARQRQARKEKAKAAKEEEKVLKKEQEEKDRYLKLSDREKRALAAERRILMVGAAQEGEGQQSPILSRCFQCAKDITGKVPFEYSNLVFCTPACVRDHRKKTCK